MPTSDQTPSHAALQQAAQWYATLLEADEDSPDRARWRTWLQDPANAHAWAQVEAVSLQFQPLRNGPHRHAAEAGLAAARSGRYSRRRVLSGLATLATVGVIGWQFPFLHRQWQIRSADLRTGTGEVRETALADGSRLWLAPGGAADVDETPAHRIVRLHQGELFLAAAMSAPAGWIVDTALAQLQALQARFNVRLRDAVLELSVQQGTVRVNAAGQAQLVGAGRQLRIESHAMGKVLPAAAGDGAWIRGLLIADQMPLGQLVDELARYRHGHLGVAPALRALPVVGVFPLRDTDAALAMLQRSLPLQVQQPLRWWTTLEPA